MKKSLLLLIFVFAFSFSNAQHNDEYLAGKKHLISGTILTTLGVGFIVFVSLAATGGSLFPAIAVGSLLSGFGVLYITSGIIDMIKHRNKKSKSIRNQFNYND